MKAKLIVRQETGRVTEFPLAKEDTKIGRVSVKNDLVLDDLAVSREHASIRRESGGWVLHDLRSANGTLVNGEWLEAPWNLTAGDVIGIGKTECTFQVEAPAKKSDEIRFGELHDMDGTIMVSVIPEELLQALKAGTPVSGAAFPAARSADPMTKGGQADSGEQEIARLQKKARILALLYELGRTLGTVFSLPEIYKKASEMLFSVTPADHCLILLKDRATGELKPASVEISEGLRARAGSHGRENIVISRTITSRCMKEGIALLVYDAQKDFGSDSIM
ncbi:MAG: FHA domain-containing protein, partial [Thermoanaerobaculia bacterium]